MPTWHPQFLFGRVLALAVCIGFTVAEKLDKFDQCKIRVNGILDDNETFGDINNETIASYIYDGPVRGMNAEFARTSRDSFITLTTEGCKAICGNPIDWYWLTDISLSLGIVSNWILPIIALLAALPYDSLHKRNSGASWSQGRLSRTIGALLNWLGSPQTALTATLFNIHQVRQCFRETQPSGSGISGDPKLWSIKRDTYYVLSCLGQFKLLNQNDAENRRFLRTLIYGLFNPMCNIVNGEGSQYTPEDESAMKWTQELLHEMAFHLRMLRRRGVYPTFLSILLFFIAYAVSLVLAFADIGERTTAHSLAFGILISWFPLLVLFGILDRNPVSADRSRKLIMRWMWNAEAVRLWVQDPDRPNRPSWWSQRKEEESRQQSRQQQQSRQRQHPSQTRYTISEFVGQGRQIRYNGLPYAVMISVYNNSEDNREMNNLDIIVNQVIDNLMRTRPASWWVLAFISLALVWLPIGMAFMISYNIPTIGLGCRSGSYVIYAFLSSLPWLIHLTPWFAYPGQWRKALCHMICALSMLSLCMIIFAAFSGVLKNCICRGGVSGYIDFESAQFYRDKAHFDVAKWWWAAAIVGALPMLGTFVAAGFLLLKLKYLWQASEHSNPQTRDVEADMHWLI